MVLFCGAGASKPAGLPLTNEILPLIVEDIKNGALFGDYDTGRRECERLRKLLYALFPTVRGAKNLPNCLSICSVLSLIDHMANSKQMPIPSWQITHLQDLQLLLEQAIAWVIETEEQETASANSFKGSMAEYIQRMAKQGTFTFITTNYDIWLERRLFRKLYNSPRKVATEFDFGFAWRDAISEKLIVYDRPTPAQRKCGWYKLHGSFNWLRCELCGQIYMNTYGSIVDICLLFPKSPDTACHCGRFPLRPLLVSPSFVRDVRDSNLLEIWRHSLEALRTAEEWVFVGYSFPEEDYVIRAMILRAYNGWERNKTQRKPRVRIISMPPSSGLDKKGRERDKIEFEIFQTRVRSILPGAEFERIGVEGLCSTDGHASVAARSR